MSSPSLGNQKEGCSSCPTLTCRREWICMADATITTITITKKEEEQEAEEKAMIDTSDNNRQPGGGPPRSIMGQLQCDLFVLLHFLPGPFPLPSPNSAKLESNRHKHLPPSARASPPSLPGRLNDCFEPPMNKANFSAERIINF